MLLSLKFQEQRQIAPLQLTFTVRTCRKRTIKIFGDFFLLFRFYMLVYKKRRCIVFQHTSVLTLLHSAKLVRRILKVRKKIMNIYKKFLLLLFIFMISQIHLLLATFNQGTYLYVEVLFRSKKSLIFTKAVVNLSLMRFFNKRINKVKIFETVFFAIFLSCLILNNFRVIVVSTS